MKHIAVAVGWVLLALTSGRTEPAKKDVAVHQTKSGKFIQVGNTY